MSRPGASPVVLLHALSQDASMWDEQRHALTRLGHLVLAPDQRGCGATPLGDDPPSLDTVADDVARALDERGIGQAVVVGSSMGGYVAMALLRRHPDRVRALGLLATRAGADSAAARADREKFAQLVVDERVRPAVLEASVPKLVGAHTRAERPDVVARVRAGAEAIEPAALAWAQRAIAARQDSFAVLRTSTVPALVVAGEEDELVPLTEARLVVDALPHGRLVTVPRAGHLTPLETPDAVTAALTELLVDTDARTAL